MKQIRIQSQAAAITALTLITLFANLPSAKAEINAGAVVCRDATTGAISSELLDLWEAHEVNGQAIMNDPTSPPVQQATSALLRLKALDIAVGEWAESNLKYSIVPNRKNLGESVKLDPPTDLKNHISTEGCSIEGLMYFDERPGKLMVIAKFFDAQSPTSMAASLVHEAVSKALREHLGTVCKGDGDDLLGSDDKFCAYHGSKIARIITGCLFTQDPGACLGLNKGTIGVHPKLEKMKDNKIHAVSMSMREENRYINKSILCSNVDGSTQVSANIDIKRTHTIVDDDTLMWVVIPRDRGWFTENELQNYFVEKLDGVKILAGPTDTANLRGVFGLVSSDDYRTFFGNGGNMGAYYKYVQAEYLGGDKFELTIGRNNSGIYGEQQSKGRTLKLSCKATTYK